jgi:dGTPase
MMTQEYIAILEGNLSRISSDAPEKDRLIRIAHERSVCDYIAGMTDDYCIAKFKEYFIPIGWKKY